jgi:putative transposase
MWNQNFSRVMKSGTFTQLHIQLVFAVKFRECLLREKYRPLIFSYMSGIVKNLRHKPLIINGYYDHVHIFLGLNPSMSISDTVSAIKKSSAFFINEKGWYPGKFRWQDGYGGFSYSRSQVNDVYAYIANQEKHHRMIKFRQEYKEMLEREEIVFNEEFLPEFFDDENYSYL